jgi:hypothetical protein
MFSFALADRHHTWQSIQTRHHMWPDMRPATHQGYSE